MKSPVVVTPAVLRELAPPQPEGSAHKGIRGCVLVIGGSEEMPGAALLAGIAALRAGAGVLQIATIESTARHLAIAIPEARVIGLAEGARGEISARCGDRLAELADGVDAVVLGPGMSDTEALSEIVPAVVAGAPRTPVVIDARALAAVTPTLTGGREASVLLTPNSKEAADLLGAEVDDIVSEPQRGLHELLDRFACPVTLRGAETYTSGPGERVYRDEGGSPGLGTSGSGDVLTGFLTGLLARGTPAVAAMVWAVHVHAQSGRRLSSRVGTLGYLARELLDDMTVVATELAG